MHATRRQFLTGSALAAGAALLPAARAEEPVAAGRAGFAWGLASYTTRKLTLDQTLDIAASTGLTQVCLKDFHLPLDSSDEVLRGAGEKARAKSVTIYAGGVIYMKTREQVDRAFAYAKTAGLRLIVGVPNADLLDAAEAKVRETGIPLAIHNHGPEDKLYPTPGSILEKIKDRDPRVGLCIDTGHTFRSGLDPGAEILKAGARLLDVHMADQPSTDPKAKRCVIGRGIMDIPALLKALQTVGFKGVAAIEETARNELDPLADLAESKGYCAGVAKVLGV